MHTPSQLHRIVHLIPALAYLQFPLHAFPHPQWWGRAHTLLASSRTVQNGIRDILVSLPCLSSDVTCLVHNWFCMLKQHFLYRGGGCVWSSHCHVHCSMHSRGVIWHHRSLASGRRQPGQHGRHTLTLRKHYSLLPMILRSTLSTWHVLNAGLLSCTARTVAAQGWMIWDVNSSPMVLGRSLWHGQANGRVICVNWLHI